jgi:hypothetical protein
MSRLRWDADDQDTIIAVGAITYVRFVLGLSAGQSYRQNGGKARLSIQLNARTRSRAA